MPLASNSSDSSELLPSGPDGFITFLYFFGLTSLIASVTIAQFLHLDLGETTPYQYAFIPGIIGGVWGTYFNRSVTVELTAKKPQEILAKLEQQLNKIGFTECQTQDALRTYSPPPFKALFMGKIRILIQKQHIRIVGRAVHLRELKKLL